MEVNRAHRRIAVVEASQPSAARFAARHAAQVAGFGDEDEYRAGLVATELATNLIKHATSGEMLVREVGGAAPWEVEIIAVDRGPGIGDVSRSLCDGHSTAGTPGTGLGAVRRLSDDFDIYSQEPRGTVVFSRLRARRAPPAATARQRSLEFGGISVAKDGEAVCGDAWQVHQRAEGALAVVADGLGHGVYASEASTAAVNAVDIRSEGDPAAKLRIVHEGLRHTRGAAAALAEIRLSPRVLTYAGIGNIAAAIDRPGSSRRAVSLNGTLGHHAQTFRSYTYPWESDALFIMCSDGLSTHWSLDDYRGLRQRHPVVVAAVLYRDFSRQRDDVTVVVGREVE